MGGKQKRAGQVAAARLKIAAGVAARFPDLMEDGLTARLYEVMEGMLGMEGRQRDWFDTARNMLDRRRQFMAELVKALEHAPTLKSPSRGGEECVALPYMTEADLAAHLAGKPLPPRRADGSPVTPSPLVVANA